MTWQADQIKRAIQEASAAVNDAYHQTPSKQDLVATYALTELEIDELREDLERRLSPLGREVLKHDKVYYEHFHQALQARAAQQPAVQGIQGREALLTAVQDGIEKGPADMLAREVAKRVPEPQLVQALQGCYEPPAGGKPVEEFTPRVCDLADKLAPTARPVFDTSVVPAPKNDLDHVGAARKLAYVVAVGEDMRVLAAADTLRERWADGQYEFCSPNLRDRLYCDMRSCDCGILSEAERLALYAAVFGLTEGDLPAGARVNRGFFPMWDRFNDTVLRFLMSDDDTEASAGTKKEGIIAATMDLQSNMSDHVTEIDMMRITDLHEQLQRELEVFNDPAVFQTVAPGCTTGWWEVVERLSGTPQDGRSSIASFELARRRDSIFEWVATFEFGDPVTGVLFDRMVDAVSALSGSAPWMPALASQERPAITGRGGELRPAYPQPEMARSLG